MSTTTFDPFRGLDRTFDRLFTDSLRSSTTSVMPMDLYRSGESFVAHIDLPGVDPATIDGDVEDRVLKDELYAAVMRCFLERLETRTARAVQS